MTSRRESNYLTVIECVFTPGVGQFGRDRVSLTSRTFLCLSKDVAESHSQRTNGPFFVVYCTVGNMTEVRRKTKVKQH